MIQWATLLILTFDIRDTSFHILIFISKIINHFMKVEFSTIIKRKHTNKEFKTSVLNSLPLTVAHQYSILRAHLNFRLSEWLLL